MQAKHLPSLRGVSLMAGALLLLSGARAADPASDAFPNFDNYMKVAAIGPSISGNDAAFQRRVQQPSSGAFGIEDMFLSKDLNKDSTMAIDGHALWGTEDYLAKVLLTKNELGSFEMGYKSFRTFYDGIGGFFPLNKQWNAMTPEDLHIDRGEFWADAKLARPNLPEFEIKYVDGFRRGKKDDTIWGDSDFTGLPNNNPPISQVRKMVPSYRDLDEHHSELEASVKATVFGNTTARLALTWESTDNTDTFYGVRFPGEAKPFPTPPTTTLLPPAQMNNQISYHEMDGQKTDMFGIRGTTDTIFNEKLTLRVGGNYEDLTSDFSGDRPLLTTTPTTVGNIIAPSNNYLNLKGHSDVTVYSGMVALEWKPASDTFEKFGLGGEDRYTKSTGSLTAVSSSVNTTTGVITITNSDQIFNSRVKENSLTPALDLRYTGIKNLSLYASGSKKTVSGDERYVTPYNPVTTPVPANGNLAMNGTSQDRLRANVGANWRTATWLELRGEVFAKDNDNDYDGYLVRTDGYVDTYHLDYKFKGYKVTAIFRADPTLSFTTRYVYQQGLGKVKSTLVAGTTMTQPVYDSMDMTNHMIGETVDWTPSSQFYMQANLNLVFNTINTVYPRAGTLPASGANIAVDINGVLQNSNNNYFNGSLLAGAVLTKTDDLLFTVTYYKADNYDPQMAALTMPYGAGAQESLVSVGLKHKFNDRCVGDAKVGYYDATNDTTGGHTDFHGPMAYVSLTFAL